MQIGGQRGLSNVEEVGFLCPVSTQHRAANSEFHVSMGSCGLWWSWTTAYSTCEISDNKLLQPNDLPYSAPQKIKLSCEKSRYFILKESTLMIGENNKIVFISFMTNFVI